MWKLEMKVKKFNTFPILFFPIPILPTRGFIDAKMNKEDKFILKIDYKYGGYICMYI